MSSHFWWYVARAGGFVAVELTSLARVRRSPKVWRGVHLSSDVLLALATVHMPSAGTDATSSVPATSAVLIGIAAVFGAAMLLTWRSAPLVRAEAPASSHAAARLVTDR